MRVTPKVELGHIWVHDVMHHGIIEVGPDTPLSEVAQLMAARRIHAVAVVNSEVPGRLWKIVSALDVVKGIRCGPDTAVKDIAATELMTISSGERLDRAGQLMAEHEVTHLLVTEGASGQPTGILSTLDILSAIAG